MNTDELIRRLSREVSPVPRHALEWRVALGTGVGFLSSAVLLSFWLGVRSDIISEPLANAFVIKLAYTSFLALSALAASTHLMRPEAKPAAWFMLAAVPAIALGVLAGVELTKTPLQVWPTLIFGKSVTACLIRISIISVPIFLGLIWAARRLAPTYFRAVGAAIGFTSGSLGAALYALHCVETAASFIFLWYSAAILIVTVIGALLGPRFLRW